MSRNNIFGDLPFCFIYLYDILIYSPDLVSHQDHLHQILQLCKDHGLTIKFIFAVSQVEFLGHHVSSSGSALLQKYCSAISQFPCPVDQPSFQRFLRIRLERYCWLQTSAKGVRLLYISYLCRRGVYILSNYLPLTTGLGITLLYLGLLS